MAKDEVIKLLKQYVLLLRSEGVHVDKALLYGSHVSGNANKESDIDILLVSNDAHNDYISGKAWRLTKKVNTRIEPYLVGKQAFINSENSPLIEAVKHNGIEIG